MPLAEAPPPLVSVVIPTLGRPTLVLRALAGVFAQTYHRIDVVVVVDGPDDATLAALRTVDDPRLRIIANPRSMTAAGARNIGAAQAHGQWIAFLDDDDEWLPHKLAAQMTLAGGRETVLVSCLSRVVTPTSSAVQPQVIYDNLMPLDEYLFDRRSLSAAVGFIQTSSYLLARSLFDRVRFRVDNPHDDWDFLLRLSKLSGTRIVTVPEVLAILHVDEPRPSLSTSGTWAASLRWIDSIRPTITRRGYGGFCLSVVGSRAAKERAYAGFFRVLYRACRYGSPRFGQACNFIGLWLVPAHFLERLRRRRARAAQNGFQEG